MKGTKLEAGCAMMHALSETMSSRLAARPDNLSSSRCCRQHKQKSEDGHVFLGNTCLEEQGPNETSGSRLVASADGMSSFRWALQPESACVLQL